MDPKRLRMLLELSRRGSMRAVAEELHHTTSTVSEQLAVLATEAGTTLLERDGRRVRLTPAGARLAEHAVTILAAIDAARADLDPHAEPAGTVRVAGFASAIRRALVPAATALNRLHPQIELRVREHEPPEALQLLAGDDVDLALVYDYDLAPRAFDEIFDVAPLWQTRWALAVPQRGRHPARTTSAPEVIAHYADAGWIANSRNTADEQAIALLASLAGVAPVITHRADSLELVEDLILAGLGVGLLPAGQATPDGIRLLELHDPRVVMRAFRVVRRGRERWAPLAAVDALLRG